MQVSKYLIWYHIFDENIQFFIWPGKFLFYATTCEWDDNGTSRKQVKTYFIRDFASGTLYASRVAFNLSNCQQKQ